jgi:hypothetical protein
MFTNFDIIENVPVESKIIQALKKMRLNKVPGPSGVTINMIRNWYHNAKECENQSQFLLEIWEKIVKLVQAAILTEICQCPSVMEYW